MDNVLFRIDFFSVYWLGGQFVLALALLIVMFLLVRFIFWKIDMRCSVALAMLRHCKRYKFAKNWKGVMYYCVFIDFFN